MDIKEARLITLDETTKGGWIERACSGSFVRVGKEDYCEREFFAALESLLQEGKVEQVPSAGQSRTSISFRRKILP